MGDFDIPDIGWFTHVCNDAGQRLLNFTVNKILFQEVTTPTIEAIPS